MHDLFLHSSGSPGCDGQQLIVIGKCCHQASAAMLGQAVPSANSDAQAYTSVRQAFLKIYR